MTRENAIARAYYVESQVDFQISRILYQNGFNSRTIFFAQQSAEKIIKACLSLKGIFIVDHNLSSVFSNVYRDQFQDISEMTRALIELERHGARARFPLFHRQNLPIWIPSEEYSVEDAMNSLTNLGVIFNKLKYFLDNYLGPSNK